MGRTGSAKSPVLSALIALRHAGRAVKVTTRRGQEWQAGNMLLSQKMVAELLAAGFLALDGDDVVLKGSLPDLL